jgi:hypothetical protein
MLASNFSEERLEISAFNYLLAQSIIAQMRDWKEGWLFSLFQSQTNKLL